MFFNEDLSIKTRNMLDQFDNEYHDIIMQEGAEEAHRDSLNITLMDLE